MIRITFNAGKKAGLSQMFKSAIFSIFIIRRRQQTIAKVFPAKE